jgi:hypothetical protein
VTHAVCIVCGTEKFGAWTLCKSCGFTPQTGLERTVALAYSDRGEYGTSLQQVSRLVRSQGTVMESGQGTFNFEPRLIELVQQAISEPGFRDMLTLRRAAKDTLLSKQLNLHEIGPDGYNAHVLKRGRDIESKIFDAIRSVGDGDLYVVVGYENGERRETAVPKDKWYAAYDLMLLVEREGPASFQASDVLRRPL